MKLKKMLLAVCSVLCLGVAGTALSGCSFLEAFMSGNGSMGDAIGGGGSVSDDGAGDNGNVGDNPIVDTTVGTEGLVYTLSEDGTCYSVTGYGGTATEVIIPNSYENLPVTSIGRYAFENCSSLTSVVIGNNVTSIGYMAFLYCSSLTSVVIGNSVTSIGEGAFGRCSSLTSVVIGDSVTSLERYAFAYCSGLTSVEIPDNVTSIGNSAFENCSGLTIYCEAESKPENWASAWNDLYDGMPGRCPVVWDCNNNNVAEDGYIYTIIDDVRYGLKNGEATVAMNATTIKEAIIETAINYNEKSYKVTSIGEYAFAYCSSLTSVEILDSVTSIGYGAFGRCSSLTSVEIPDSVTSIGGIAFFGCSRLTSVLIPDSVTNIGEIAFERCPLLIIHCEAESQPENWASAWNSSQCPVVWDCNNNNVAEDGYIYTVIDGSRYGLKDGEATVASSSYAIKKAVIQSVINYNEKSYTVTSIGEDAFRDCGILTSVEIPDSVRSIGEAAFDGCENLTSVVIPDSVTSIGDSAFYCCRRLTSAEIGDSVTSIGDSAFYGCWSLMSVVIPDGVTSIGSAAFDGCENLTSVVIPDSVTSIGDSAFMECSNLTIYCVAESQPEGWDADWNSSNCPVEWGYKGE